MIPKEIKPYYDFLISDSDNVFIQKPSILQGNSNVGYLKKSQIYEKIENLINALKEKGPFLALGQLGPQFYLKSASKMKQNVKGQEIYFWPAQSERIENRPMDMVFILGAMKNDTNQLVYFTPSEKTNFINNVFIEQKASITDSKIYATSYKSFCQYALCLYPPSFPLIALSNKGCDEQKINSKRVNKQENGARTIYTNDGGRQEFNYTNWGKDGTSTITSPTGVVVECAYKDGVRQGKATQKDNDAVIEFNFVDGERQGNALQTFKDGATIEFIYKNGKGEGPAKFFKEGIVTIEFTYINDEREGPAKEIQNNGTVMEFTYLNGVKNGPAREIFPDGRIIEFKYANGKRLPEATEIRPNGTKLKFLYRDS
ncbi:MAG: hypothetical protein H0V82_00415 [Candidatus Protochlamydia sp.]|nr:hypothetical protein [Candidatus Protochlamydia sp.]